MTPGRFRAMGCEVVVGGARPEEFAAVERLFARWEQIFSRFLPGSELNHVNARAGRPVIVSPLFARAVEVAVQAAEETDGLVDPTVGQALEAAGYVDDFDRLLPDSAPVGPPSPGAFRSLVCRGRLLRFPAGIRLDLNGVVKAMAVDASLELFSGGGGFVSAGGDLAVRAPTTVRLPGRNTVLLRSGALATSGAAKRRWLRGGDEQHHLIDPRNGRPADSPWTQVTVCGATCVAADAAAKAAFLAGEEGPDWLDARGLPGRFLDHQGDVLANDAWQRSLAEAVACT